MKLNYKIYSPFYLITLLIVILSCNEQKQKVILHTALSTQESLLLSSYKQKAVEFMNTQAYDSAFKYFNKSRELYASVKDSLGEGYCLLHMADIQEISGDYSGCEETATEALPLLENLKYRNYLSKQENLFYLKYKKEYLSKAYNLLGVCYKNLLNSERAIQFYNNAKNLTQDSLAHCILENNKATVYLQSKNYEKAYQVLIKLIKSPTVLNHTDTKAMVLNNLGAAAGALNNPDALSYLESSLRIRTSNNDLLGMASSYIQLGAFYSTKNKNKTLLYAQKGYDIATNLKNADKRLEALKILTSVSPGKAEALKYITISDSLDKSRIKAKSEFASLKYESKNAEAENLKLKTEQAKNMLQAQRDKTLRVLLGTAAILILIICAFIIYLQKLKHKKAKIIEVYNTESRISKKIHDELANDVFNVMSFAETQETQYPGQQKLIQELDVIYKKTRDISRENNTIDTGENFGSVLREMLADYKNENINVMVINFESIAWGEIAGHKKITVYRVLQELMVNMKKHSHADVVAIKFSRENKTITIQYSDNGIGLGNERLLYKNGLQNAENRISAIDGTLTFETSTNGLKVKCIFPA